jgi:hypothetical protein
VTDHRPVSGGRIGELLAASCGVLYVVLLVGGDDFLNPAGEVPGPEASLRDFTSYVAKADTSNFWLGRSIGLLALCALLVFVAYVSHRIATAADAGTLPKVTFGAGLLVVTLQFMAAPPQFAAVQSGRNIEPEVTRALLTQNVSFSLSFFPLAFFLACVAVAGLRDRALPRWLAAIAGALALGLIGGVIGRPQEPAVASYMAFFLTLFWFATASIAFMVGRIRSNGG